MSRILMISHGHPDLTPGGAEIAAYRQCRELRSLGHKVVFLARDANAPARGGTPFSAIDGGDPDDLLFQSMDFDHFLHSQRAKWTVYKSFRDLLEWFAPDVVHFHHYVFLGVEFIREVRKYAPSIPLIVTLHEYIAICNNLGQMIKTDGRLCERARPADCHACFPGKSTQDFFLRENFIKSFFALVDVFICPSRFLLERYAQWGIARERLVVIENGQPDIADPQADEDAGELSHVFGYFGQLSELKGIFLLLDAIRRLPRPLRDVARFVIHGTTRNQNEAFRTRLARQVSAMPGLVHYHGDYRQSDLSSLMRRVGWVVVPSIWWENSPLVIQEAFNHRRPVICGNIGGMAEKVIHGQTGLHFIAGDTLDLTQRIAQACDPALWTSLRNRIEPPVTISHVVADHLALYRRLAARRPARASRNRSEVMPLDLA
jgi:glycosyltransferase involved in cell wall biosynthesis